MQRLLSRDVPSLESSPVRIAGLMCVCSRCPGRRHSCCSRLLLAAHNLWGLLAAAWLWGGIPELSSCFGIRALFFFFSFCLTAFHAGASCLRKQGCPAERLSSPARFQRSLLLFCGGPSPRLAAGERARRQSWSGRNVPGAAGTAPGCGAARGGPGAALRQLWVPRRCRLVGREGWKMCCDGNFPTQVSKATELVGLRRLEAEWDKSIIQIINTLSGQCCGDNTNACLFCLPALRRFLHPPALAGGDYEIVGVCCAGGRCYGWGGVRGNCLSLETEGGT